MVLSGDTYTYSRGTLCVICNHALKNIIVANWLYTERDVGVYLVISSMPKDNMVRDNVILMWMYIRHTGYYIIIGENLQLPT